MIRPIRVGAIVSALGSGWARDRVSADLFEIELEKAVSERLRWAEEVFPDDAALRSLEVSELDEELRELERRLSEREDWELCARVRDVRSRLRPNT